MDTQQRALATIGTRPWPIPRRPWVMTQVWRKLLFAHWPLPPEVVRPHLPSGLPLDTFSGRAWVGVVPFLMEGVRFRGAPGVPTAQRFPELNVRTYVTLDNKPGVYFFSLDAGSRLAVVGARALFALPYHRARFVISADEDGVRYRCERLGAAPGEAPRATFAARYRLTGPVRLARAGSLEDWLTARYCLYTTRGGHLLRGEIHHAPWPLQPAEADILQNTMAEPAGIRLPESPPLLHYSERLEVVVWPLQPVG
ncbi:MAG TPA: DUF2071 domain-containing protein [Ktedonobacterales bacterium]